MRKRDVFKGVPKKKPANQETRNRLEQVALAARRAHPRMQAGADAAGWVGTNKRIGFYCIVGYASLHL